MAFWLSVAVLLVFGLPGAASAQQTFSGRAADPLDGSCVNVRDVSINWRDGTVSPATFSTSDDVIDIGGSPIPIKWLDLTGTHSYAVAGTYDVLVNYRTTCLNASGEAYEFNAVNKPGFRVSATGSSPPPPAGPPPPGPPPPDSCPLAQATSFVRISQASCPIQYTPALRKAEKKIFRQLAGIAYKGYVVDKAFDDVVSFPGTVVSEGFFGKNAAADLVIGKFWGDYLERLVAGKGAKGLFGKARPWGWILNAPKYASYLDYVKYAVLSRLADDPPDPNFTALASPPKLRRLRGAPRQVGQRDRREAGLYIALLTTVERAAGAQLAGAAAAQSAQLRHASGIAKQLVSLLGAKQKALKAAAKTVKRIRAGRLPRSVVRRAKRRLDPRSLTPALRKLGFTRNEITAVRQSAPSVPLKPLTAPFQKVLGLGAEARTVGAARAALANFANRHALGE
jgi:hypothetical protein